MKKNLSGFLLIIYFYGFQIVSLFIGMVIFGDDLSSFARVLDTLSVMELGLIFILYKRYQEKISKTIKTIILAKKEFFQLFAKYFLILIVANIIIGTIDSILFPELSEYVGENQDTIEMVINGNFNLLLFSSIVITGPIIEEYIFRYGVMDKLLDKMSSRAKIICTTLIFAFIHIGMVQALYISLPQFIHLMLIYASLSFVVAYAYEREKNLAIPILLHATSNFISIIYLLNI